MRWERILMLSQDVPNDDEGQQDEADANENPDDQMGETGKDAELQELNDGWEQPDQTDEAKEQEDGESLKEEAQEYTPDGQIPNQEKGQSQLEAKDKVDKLSNQQEKSGMMTRWVQLEKIMLIVSMVKRSKKIMCLI